MNNDIKVMPMHKIFVIAKKLMNSGMFIEIAYHLV